MDAAQIRSAIGTARRALDEGHPAHALGLGLYLHWYDSDDVRTESGELLRDAYRSLGWHQFEEILSQHLHHRDLPSVDVL